MKKIKTIILVIAVAVAVAVSVAICYSRVDDPKQTQLPKNQFTDKIIQEIDQLKSKSNYSFCKNSHDDIAYLINTWYKDDRFGNNQLENDQWKENLEKLLYAAYVDKFIAQATTVFRGSKWPLADLRFIQSEKNALKKSKFLVAGSPVDKDLMSIQTVLNKYNEIVGFISQCNGLSYLSSALSDSFPIAKAQSNISQAEALLNNRLENDYVNHCTRLHESLKAVPQTQFRSHTRYLDNKINFWSGKYSEYPTQREYANELFNPLKAEIDLLDNDMYNVSNFDSEYRRLIKKLNDDSDAAYQYFSNN